MLAQTEGITPVTLLALAQVAVGGGKQFLKIDNYTLLGVVN
jgi:hypothetical protein